jgi:hypothetical protein
MVVRETGDTTHDVIMFLFLHVPTVMVSFFSIPEHPFYTNQILHGLDMFEFDCRLHLIKQVRNDHWFVLIRTQERERETVVRSGLTPLRCILLTLEGSLLTCLNPTPTPMLILMLMLTSTQKKPPTNQPTNQPTLTQHYSNSTLCPCCCLLALSARLLLRLSAKALTSVPVPASVPP